MLEYFPSFRADRADRADRTQMFIAGQQDQEEEEVRLNFATLKMERFGQTRSPWRIFRRICPNGERFTMICPSRAGWRAEPVRREREPERRACGALQHRSVPTSLDLRPSLASSDCPTGFRWSWAIGGVSVASVRNQSPFDVFCLSSRGSRAIQLGLFSPYRCRVLLRLTVSTRKCEEMVWTYHQIELGDGTRASTMFVVILVTKWRRSKDCDMRLGLDHFLLLGLRPFVWQFFSGFVSWEAAVVWVGVQLCAVKGWRSSLCLEFLVSEEEDGGVRRCVGFGCVWTLVRDETVQFSSARFGWCAQYLPCSFINVDRFWAQWGLKQGLKAVGVLGSSRWVSQFSRN